MPAVTMVLAWHLLSRFFASNRMAEPATTMPSLATPDDSNGLSGDESRGGHVWQRWQGALPSWRPAVTDRREMPWPRD